MRRIRTLTATVGLIVGLSAAVISSPVASAEGAPVQPYPGVTIQQEEVATLPSSAGGVTPMSANGCTTAPGPLASGSHNCVVVNGNGTRIDSAYSQYYYAQPIGPNVCDRQHQFLYTRSDGVVVNRQVNPGGCINAIAMVATGDYVSLPEAPLYAKSGTSFCTRAKNNQTGGSWTPYACVNIH